MKTIPLNIMLSYPVQWKKDRILRDIVQNFYDDVGLREFEKAFKTEYDQIEKSVSLTVTSEGFSYEWLLHMGASTKQDKPGAFAGFFGEGFKVAALCALRDFAWKIKMCSRNWILEVIALKTVIDGKEMQQLAYQVEERESFIDETILTLSPFSNEDNDLLRDVVLGFYFPENQLLGKRIFENEYAAIYERSKQSKPAHFPEGFDLKGDGIVFIGYQARGSFGRPLVLCNHRFITRERERHDIHFGTVLDMLIDLVDLIDAHVCCYLLEQLEPYWYDYPDKKEDMESWYPIIRKLIRKIVFYDPALARDFTEKHSNLVVCERPLNLYMRNRKTQALAWMKQCISNSRLVQDSFLLMGYSSVVDLCEKAGGFNITRTPVYQETVLFSILAQAAKEIMPGFFDEYPPCLIIENESASVAGMARLNKNKENKRNKHGYHFRYRLSQIEIKRNLLTKENFSKAFSTYCHELCHCFGGDASATFSLALTDAMTYIIENRGKLQQYYRLWQEQFDAGFEDTAKLNTKKDAI
jgi:hypothetical protein